MCLGLPGRIVSLDEGTNLGRVEVAGVVREIDLSLLQGPLAPGDYLLVYSGIALERMSPDQAQEAEAWFPASAAEVPPPEVGPLLREERAEDQ
jgi:hydrogenase expression/formation protein HypC